MGSFILGESRAMPAKEARLFTALQIASNLSWMHCQVAKWGVVQGLLIPQFVRDILVVSIDTPGIQSSKKIATYAS